MADFIAQFGGIGLAFLGAALAVGLCCVGSARGTGMVGEAATGVLSENPEHFSKWRILKVMAGTPGRGGLGLWFCGARRLGEGNYSMRYRGVLRHPVPAGLCIAADERPVRSSTREKGGSK